MPSTGTAYACSCTWAQTFDGAGNFTASNYISVNGVLGLYSFTGTYTLAADCTGVAVAHFPGGMTSSQYFVVVDHAKSLYSLSLDPGSIITGVFTRVGELHSEEGR